MERAFRYVRDVESGKITTNYEIKLAVKRFKRDLKKFDLREEETQRAIIFTELLRFSKGKKAGERIVWGDWQIFCLVNIFGFHYKKTGKRRFRYFYIEVARKSGKSTFLAAIGLVFLTQFDEAIPECYAGASAEKQAEPVFKEMSRMITRLRIDFKEMDDSFAVFKKSIIYTSELPDGSPNEGIFAMVASNAPTLDGLNPFCTLLDELHSHKDSSLFNVFKSGTGSRDKNQPLIAMITTAGFSLKSFAYMIRKNFIQILERSKTDEDTFIMIFSLDKDDDYTDEKTWMKANPSLGASMTMEWLQAEFRQAQNFASELNNFLTKNLNKWVGGVSTWLDRQLLDKNDGRDLLPDEIEEGIVYLGLDLGMVNDVSALAQVTMFGDERIHVKMRYYMSETAYHKFIGMGVPFDVWVKQGISINVNAGQVTDTRVIVRDVIEIVENLDVDKIGFDRWNTNEIVSQLDDLGIMVEGVGQGYRTHTEVVSFVERAMYEKRFCLLDDDCLKWMFSNVVLDQDPAGNRKLNKSKADNKIDGISALFNALWYYTQVDQGRDDYAGIRTISLR